ncbi:MAG: hypothetical protein IPI58_00295 [Alphaproteobacteria bacterium]|nr:MAG: hypothetical protein IPI58_00295 [Alphaproteobacteria bacterium]
MEEAGYTPPPACCASAFKLGTQSGIAIGPILFIVAILAVLAAAIAAGSGSFHGDTSTVGAKAQASAILEYADEVKFAVDRVLAKGCTDTQVSFENPFVSGYTNSNAPSDKSCHVFDVNGGGISYKYPPPQVLDASLSGYTGYGQYFFTSTLSVKGIGNGQTTTSLIMMMPFLKKEVANSINKYSNVIGNLEVNALCNFAYVPGNYFTGSYYPPCSGTFDGNGDAAQQYGTHVTANVAGHTSGCITNQFGPLSESNCFKVLIVR